MPARPGAATVPAHTLYDIVRKLPEGAQVQLELSGDGQQTTIKAGRSRFQLATPAERGFPGDRLAASCRTSSRSRPRT